MATYLMFGKYTLEALKGISAKRTDEAQALIKQHGGTLKAAYALLGETDLVLIVDLPDNGQAMKLSAAMAQKFSIAFTTAPAVSVEDFDKLMG